VVTYSGSQSHRHDQLLQGGHAGLKGKEGRPDHKSGLGSGVSGEKGLEGIRRLQGRRDRIHQIPGKDLGWYGITVNAVAPAFVHSPMTAFLNPELEKKWLKPIRSSVSGTPGYCQHDRFLMLAALLLDHRPDDFHQWRVFDEVKMAS